MLTMRFGAPRLCTNIAATLESDCNELLSNCRFNIVVACCCVTSVQHAYDGAMGTDGPSATTHEEERWNIDDWANPACACRP
jgi:hypothetical protein